LVVLVVVAEQLLERELLLLAGLDEEDFGAELLREQLDHVVGERLRCRHHLAGREQEADDVGRAAVELRTELLRRDAALDDDLAAGHRRARRAVRRQLGGRQLLERATTTTTALRRAGPALAGPTASGTAGTPARATTTDAGTGDRATRELATARTTSGVA